MKIKNVVAVSMMGVRFKAKQIETLHCTATVVYADIMSFNGKPEWCWQLWPVNESDPPALWFDSWDDMIAKLEEMFGAPSMPRILQALDSIYMSRSGE